VTEIARSLNFGDPVVQTEDVIDYNTLHIADAILDEAQTSSATTNDELTRILWFFEAFNSHNENIGVAASENCLFEVIG
jgi:hypothetical protein